MSKNPQTAAAAANKIAQDPSKLDFTLRSTPDTVLWGYIAANLPPALTIKPRQIVAIELSHQGLTTNKDPEEFSLPGA